MKVTDLNEFAVTNTDISEALRRSASAMAVANNSMDQTIALATAATEITRDPEAAGTMLKTVSMRIRGLSEETGQADAELSNMGDTIKELSGVSIFTDDTQKTYKSTYDILKEISAVYSTLDDRGQANLLKMIAGLRQGNQVAAILKNWSTAEKALEVQANSAGGAMREQATYMDSISARINTFKESLVGLWQGAIDSTALKTVVDLGTSLVTVLNFLINKTGGLIPILATITALTIAYNTVKKTKLGLTIAETMATIKNTVSIVALGVANTVTAITTKGLSAATGELALMFEALGVTTPLLIITALVAVIAGGIAIFDALTTSFAEQQEIVSNLISEIQSLQSEYDTLFEKTNRTDAENATLKVLEAQLAVKKELLAIESQNTYDAYKNNSNRMAGENASMFQERYNAGNQEILNLDESQFSSYDAYAKKLAELNDLQAQRKEHLLEWTSLASKELALLQDIIDRGGELNDVDQKQYDLLTNVITGVGDLVNQEEDLTGTTDNTTESTTNLNTSLNDLIGNLNTAQNAFKSLTEAMQDFNEDGQLSYSSIADIADKFKDVDGIDGYINKLADANLTASEFQSTMNDLAIAYIQQQVETGKLTEENINMTVKMLEEAGVVNALAIVNWALANSASGASGALMSEGTSANYAKAGLDGAKNSAAGLGNTSINTSGIVDQINNITSAAYTAANGLLIMQNHLAGKTTTGATSTASGKTAMGLPMPTPVVKAPTVAWNPKVTSGSSSGGGGKSEDKAYEYDQFYKEKQRVVDAENKVAIAERELKDIIGDSNESLRQKNVLLAEENALYEKQQEKLSNLNDARDTQIKLYANDLLNSNVTSSYDADANRLVVNYEDIAKLTGEARTTADDLAKSMEDLNSANQDGSSKYVDLTDKIQSNTIAMQGNIKAQNQNTYDYLEKVADKQTDLIQKQIDALKAKHDAEEKENALLEKQNDLIKKQQELLNASKEKNVKQLQGTEFEWIANPNTISDLKEALSDASEAYNNEKADQEYEASIKALEDAQDKIKDQLKIASDLLDDTITDTSMNLSSLNSAIQSLISTLSKSGTSSSTSTSGLSANEVAYFTSQMQSNSSDYNKLSSDSEKSELAKANQTIGKALGYTYDDGTGAWYTDNTKTVKAYHSGTVGAGGKTFDPQQEEFVKLLKGEPVLSESMVMNGIGLMNNLKSLTNMNSIITNNSSSSPSTDNSMSIGNVNVNAPRDANWDSIISLLNNVQKIKR